MRNEELASIFAQSLTSQLKAALRQVKGPLTAAMEEEAPARRGGRKWGFKPEALAAKRAEFGISANDMAKLLQAGLASVNRLETGKASPRAAQLEWIHDVLGLGKRKALALVAEAQ